MAIPTRLADISREEAAISARIFVGNLSFRTTQDQLTQLMSAAGRIMSVHLPADRETGRPRGFAFVEFSNATEAAEAIRLFNERDLDGRKLRLNPADERPPRAEGFRRGQSAGASFGLNAFAPDGRPPRNRPFKTKGSRRGLRGRKRSL